MGIVCISDLHLGDRGPRDNFAVEGREYRFQRFLDWVGPSRLLILGDLFDWWQVPVGAAIKAYGPLLDRLGRMSATWIMGNHDNALSALAGTALMPDHPLLRRARGPLQDTAYKCLFMHGHEPDPYCNSANPGTGEITAIISGILEDRNKGPVRHGRVIEDQFVGGLEKLLTLWRTLTRQAGRLQEMVNGVEEYRRDKGAEVVVYGHTHCPGQIGTHHFNCGSWCRHMDTFVYLDDTGNVGVYEWTLSNQPKRLERSCAEELG